MQAYRIDWTESESGWGRRPDGYSFHTTLEAAREYLTTLYNNLPKEIPDEYSFPTNGWKEPALAVLVEIPDDGILAKELAEGLNTRVFCSYADTPCGREYKEARAVKVVDAPVAVSYGEKGYNLAEQELLAVRQEIGERLEERKLSPIRAILESEAMIDYLGFGD